MGDVVPFSRPIRHAASTPEVLGGAEEARLEALKEMSVILEVTSMASELSRDAANQARRQKVAEYIGGPTTGVASEIIK